MKLSIIMLAIAATCAANDQAALVPDAATDREMQALLSMDSFNITSADSEQNRMHAVCDMEYRLSKMTKGPALGLLNMASDPSSVSLFNPFTMPLMAVKQHISLLQQEETFLQAQSDAFSGSSSSSDATTAAASTFTMKCVKVAKDCTGAGCVAVTAGVPDNSIMVEFGGTGVVKPLQELHIYYDMGAARVAGTTPKWVPATYAINGVSGGESTAPCLNTEGSDAQCKTAAGAAMAATDLVVVEAPTTKSWKPEGTLASAAENTLENMAGVGNVKTLNAGIMQKFKLASGLEAITQGKWFLGMITAQPTTATPATVTMEFTAGGNSDAGFVGKQSCTTPL